MNFPLTNKKKTLIIKLERFQEERIGTYGNYYDQP